MARRAVTMLLAVACLLLTGAGKPSADPLSDAAVALQSEVLLLVQLHGLRGPVPAELVRVHDAWASYTRGMDRPALLAWLDDVDRQGTEARARAVAAGLPLSAAARRVLGRLTPADRAALQAGHIINLDPSQYAQALHDLDEPSVRAPAPATAGSSAAAETSGTTATGASPSSPATSPTTSADVAGGQPAEHPAGPPIVVIVAAMLGGLGLAGATGVVLLRLRRRRAGHRGRRPGLDPAAAIDRLLDAGRRMTGALDVDAIARIAVAEAVPLAGAVSGAFVRVLADGLETRHDPDGVLSPPRPDAGLRPDAGPQPHAGLLRRVAETGQSVLTVSRDDPALADRPCAVLAVPVTGSGRVIGVLLLVRPGSSPFGPDDEHAVSRLTPLVGSALLAAEQHDGVSELTRTDALTGLANRRCLDVDLAELTATVARTAAEARRGAVAMIDVDHFKIFNDRNGHAAGDAALQAVADALRGGVRDVLDTPYRYGGEEFSLVLRGVDEAVALEIVERVRAAVEASDVPGAANQPSGRLTVSIGLAMLGGQEPATALLQADEALYRAKEGGRNRVVTSPTSPVTLSPEHQGPPR